MWIHDVENVSANWFSYAQMEYDKLIGQIDRKLIIFGCILGRKVVSRQYLPQLE